MKVHSLAPYEFRGSKLPKGESEFDFDALNTSDKAFFEGLVKAEIVKVLTDAPKEPEKADGDAGKVDGGDASASSDPPAPPPAPKKKPQ